MKKVVPAGSVEDIRDFPYKWNNWDYDPALLRSILYAPDDPDLCDEEHTLVMDYDGILEWFLSWRDADEILHDMDPAEYVAYHLGRTISPVRPVDAIPIVFINCRRFPFVHWIMRRFKLYETRTRNMLGSLIGRRVLIAETGNGKPVVKCSAVIDEVVPVYSREAWERYRSCTRIEIGSEYDWKPGTKVKYLYRLADVRPVQPFIPPEGLRHGRVWMEYYGTI